MNDARGGALRIIRVAVGAGALGTALVGLGEALHLWRAVGLGFGDGAGTVLYAAGLHGLFGAAGGLALGLLALGAGRLRALAPRVTPEATGAVACAVALFLGVLVVGTFRFQRDTALGGPAALAVAFGLALVLAVAGAFLARALASRTGGLLGEGLLAASVVGLLAGRALLTPATAVPAPSQRAAGDERPNVILVVADTLRSDVTGPYGGRGEDGQSLTPNLDRFAAEGMVFERFYANATWTRPTMASLFTSRIPSGHGAIHQEDPLHPELPHLAKAFASAGYATAATVTNVNLAPDFGFDMGFDTYRYHGPIRPLWARGPAVRLSLINVVRLVHERITDRLHPDRFYAEGPRITGDALDLVDGLKGGAPFFLWVHYMDPHDPFFRHPFDGHAIARVRDPNPPPSVAPEMRALYEGDVEYWDRHFGALLDGLAERGLLENTVIAVTSDHGEEFYEHGGWWHGQTLYDELTRVPLVVRLAGGAAGGHRDPRLASLVDVAPTLLSSAGVEVPEEMRGINLLGAGTGDDGSERVVLMEEDHHGMVLSGLVWDRYKIFTAQPDNPRGFPPVQLFDLEADPEERRDLSGEMTERVTELLELLERRLAGEPAAPPPAERRTVEVDEALEEDLRALGYIQ